MAEGQGRLVHGVFSQGEPADTPRDLALQRPRVNKPVNVGELLARMRIALRHRMQRKVTHKQILTADWGTAHIEDQ